MPESIIGFSNTADSVTAVGLTFTDDLIEVFLDNSWPLQKGDRAQAYHAMRERIVNELRERNIKKVVIKASVPAPRSTQLSHLHSAELRGVIMAAAAQAQSYPEMITKATMSRKFGERKTEEYVNDPGFWSETVSGKLRIGSRETALLILMVRK